MDDQAMADLLRTAKFALDRAGTALVAFCDRRYVDSIQRDYDRTKEATRQINEALKALPPPIPMSPEREATIGAFIAAVLDKRFGDGSDAAVRAAAEGLLS